MTGTIAERALSQGGIALLLGRVGNTFIYGPHPLNRAAAKYEHRIRAPGDATEHREHAQDGYPLRFAKPTADDHRDKGTYHRGNRRG